MPSDQWTEQETQLLKRAVRAVPSDLEKNDRWRQVAVLVGGGRGKKECYEYWKALNKAKAAPVIRRPPSPKEPVRRPKAQTDRVRARKQREEVLVVDIDDSPQRDEGKDDDYSEDAFEEDLSQQLERSAIGAATWRRDVGPGATLAHRRADALDSYDERDDERDSPRRDDGIRRPAYDDSDDEGRRDVKRRPRGSERSVSRDEAVSLRELLLGDAKRKPPSSWLKQGFRFCDNLEGCGYGLIQKQGGPCGVLAAVNAEAAAELVRYGDWTAPSSDRRESALAKALSRIVRRCCTASKALVCVPGDKPKVERSSSYTPDSVTECCRVWTVDIDEIETLFSYFIDDFMDNGCLLVLYSCLLSRTIEGVRSDGDESTSLLDRHGYANQCAVNLLLTGRATSNVFDGNKQMDDLVLRGVSQRSDVGFLTLLEAYQHCSVGRNFKAPRSRVWVVYSESHYSLLVGDPSSEYDLHYWDGLANQDEVIRLTVDEDYYAGRDVPDVNDSSLLIPPLDLVVRSLYPNAKVDWNGAEPIL